MSCVEYGEALSCSRECYVIDTRIVAPTTGGVPRDITYYDVVEFEAFGFVDGYHGHEFVGEQVSFVEGPQFGQA